MKSFHTKFEKLEFLSEARAAYRDAMTRAARLLDAPPAATAIVALTAVLFGLVPLFARELQAEGVGAASIALSRYALSAALLVPFLPLARAKRREALLIGGAGMAMGLGWIGYLRAIETAPIAAAGVIYMAYPLFCVLFAWLLLRQRPTRRAVAAGLLILLAAGLLLDPGALGPGAVHALLWSLPAPLTFGFLIVVLCALTPTLTPLEKMAAGMAGATLGLAPVVLGQEAGSILPQTTEGWGWIAGLGLTTALLPQLLYTLAAPRVGAARAAAAGSVELPTMFAVGWVAFGEPLGVRAAFAAALVLTAIALSPAIRPATTRAPRPAPEVA
jgi:drug/metabolite transporter (DMT)-like permease